MLRHEILTYQIMIEYFRKYSGIAFAVLIVLFIGLIFMVDGIGRNGVGTGAKLMSYEGRVYTHSEVERQGADFSNMLQNLLRAGYSSAFTELSPYIYNVIDTDATAYLGKRLMLKSLTEEYGLAASEAQVETFIQETLFVDADGNFDKAGYVEFIEKRVKRLGLGVQDFNTLIGEVLAVKKLQEVIGSGYEISEEVTRKSAKVFAQKTTYEQFSLSIAKIEENIKVTEEEVKAYWEEKKFNYLTDPEVKVQFVVADANVTAVEAQKKAAMKAEARAAGKTEEEIEALSYVFPEEEKNALINEQGDLIDSFFVKLQDADGKGFKTIAEELGLEVTETEFFSANKAPFELKIPVTGGQGTGAYYALQLTPEVDSMTSVSDVLPIGEGRFLMLQVLDKKPSEPKTFEDAQARAEVDLVSERASGSLDAEVAKLRDELVAKAGEGEIAQVAKSLGLVYNKRDEITLGSTITGEPAARELFNEVVQVPLNEFSEPIIQDDKSRGLSRAVILRPLSRVYEETEESKSSIDSQVENSSSFLETIVFEHWFRNQFDNAEFEKL